MRHIFLAAILCFAFSLASLGQEADDTPASRADIQTYFEAVHARDSMNQMMEAMLKSMRQLMHDQYLKNKDKLPEDYEQRMSKQMDDMMRNMPWDEMMQATIPAYQKHFTKGDVNTLLAFYSSPTGQKLLRDLPAMMSESMEAMMPIMSRYLEEMQNKIKQETDEMIQQSEKKAAAPNSN
jgi:hypothetical protein